MTRRSRGQTIQRDEYFCDELGPPVMRSSNYISSWGLSGSEFRSWFKNCWDPTCRTALWHFESTWGLEIIEQSKMTWTYMDHHGPPIHVFFNDFPVSLLILLHSFECWSGRRLRLAIYVDGKAVAPEFRDAIFKGLAAGCEPATCEIWATGPPESPWTPRQITCGLVLQV